MGYEVNIAIQNVKYDVCYRMLSSKTTVFNENKNNDLSSHITLKIGMLWMCVPPDRNVEA